MDSGVFVNKAGHRTIIENNFIKGNLYGVYLWGSKDAILSKNIVVGMKTGHVNSRGNGVSVWNSPGSKIENNDISFGRDGIFSTTSRNNTFNNNTFNILKGAFCIRVPLFTYYI